MTPKNPTRLRRFDDEAHIRDLVNLPERLVAQAARSGRGLRKKALQVQFALAIAILLVAAPRIANLTGLNIDRHIIRTRPGAKGIIHLVIPGVETKTGEPQEFALPAWVARILEVYLTAYRPQLLQAPSSWLFPNLDGGRRSNSCFARQIAVIIKKHTGLQMNVHLFRHLTVKLCHQASPGDAETPQRLLNHRSGRTTQRFYSEFDAQSAHSRYDAV